MIIFRSAVSAVILSALIACQSTEPYISDGAAVTNNVSTLHGQVLTLDTHIDIPLTYMTDIDPGGPTALQVDLGKMDAGQLDAGFFIVYTPQGDLTVSGYDQAANIAKTRLAAIQDMVRVYPDRIKLAQTADDVRRWVAADKHAALIGMENAYPLGESVEAVDWWADQGVRYMGITHFGHNQFGDSSNPHPMRDGMAPRHDGLSRLGQDLVRAMNDHGIMVDVSHAGKATMMQAADLSRTPIIASHSGARAVADSPRNLDDEQLRKIAEVNGVVQIVALDSYVKPLSTAQESFRDALRRELRLETAKARAAMSDELKAEYETRLEAIWAIEPRASVADFVDHIDHAVKIAGIDHVGIASDFDGGGGITGWDDAAESENVTAELIRRGYSAEDIGKIWGGNLLRVLETVEAAKTVKP